MACTDLRGHGDSDATFTSYGDEETAGDVIALLEELGGPAVVVGNSMGAGAAALAAAERPELVSGLVLAGPFVRNPRDKRDAAARAARGHGTAMGGHLLEVLPAQAVRRPPAADFGEYRDQVIASIRRPGYAKAFSRTTRTSHDPAQARLAEVTAPALVVMGEQDPDFPDPRAEADWIARALRAQVVMVPDAGHYPQSQRPDITTGAVLSFLESVTGTAQAALIRPGTSEEAGRIAGEVTQSRDRK